MKQTIIRIYEDIHQTATKLSLNTDCFFSKRIKMSGKKNIEGIIGSFEEEERTTAEPQQRHDSVLAVKGIKSEATS